MVKLFISHSERDKVMIEPLYKWLKCGLDLEAKEIRCTSVESMVAGDASMQTLRTELQSAEVVVGVITSNSLRSHWVSIEMGAAWLRDRLYPVRGPGIYASKLPNPLPSIYSPGLCEKPAMQKLLRNLAESLGREEIAAAKFELDEMITTCEQHFLRELSAWFSLPPVLAAWRSDETRFNYSLRSLCKQLALDEKELINACTDHGGNIRRSPEHMPVWAKDYWNLSKMAVNQLLEGDQDLLDMPIHVLNEQLAADLKRALDLQTSKRGPLLYDWFENVNDWIVHHPPMGQEPD